MRRCQGWEIGLLISIAIWCVLIGGTCAMVGCDGGLGEGVLIGLGASKASTEASDMARESKTALVAKILQLQQELEAAATPEQQAALQGQLDAAIKKQEYAELTATIADTVKAALERDWGKNPTQGQEGKNNLAYLLASIATVATGYAGKKTYDVVQKDKAINRVKVASKAADTKIDQGEVYKAFNGV